MAALAIVAGHEAVALPNLYIMTINGSVACSPPTDRRNIHADAALGDAGRVSAFNKRRL